jgi:hypothetical protein
MLVIPDTWEDPGSRALWQKVSETSISTKKLSVMVHACCPSTWEDEAGEWRVPDKPGLLGVSKMKKSSNRNKKKKPSA